MKNREILRKQKKLVNEVDKLAENQKKNLESLNSTSH